MSAASPSMGVSSSYEHDLATAYEDLRGAALEANGHARRLPGVAVVLRAGVAAWMQACRSVAAPVPAIPPTGETTRALPGAVRAEVAVLLAQMAMAAAATITP